MNYIEIKLNITIIIKPKFSQKFSQNLNKISLENCSNFSGILQKISRKFSL